MDSQTVLREATCIATEAKHLSEGTMSWSDVVATLVAAHVDEVSANMIADGIKPIVKLPKPIRDSQRYRRRDVKAHVRSVIERHRECLREMLFMEDMLSMALRGFEEGA